MDWSGLLVSVMVGPNGPIDEGSGLVWSHMAGPISRSEEGAAWSSDEADGAPPEGIAFQIGENERSYFVLYREHFENAAWISREHRFFVVEMRGAQIGVSADSPS